MSMNQINYNIEIFLLGVLLCLFGASMASYRLGKYAADRWYAEHANKDFPIHVRLVDGTDYKCESEGATK